MSKIKPNRPKISAGMRFANILKLKRRFLDAEMKSIGFSRAQWQTLFWLYRLAPCTQKELLKNMDMDGAQLARIMDCFDKKGYIDRTPLPEDRRILHVKLSPYSKKKLIPHLEKALVKEEKILLSLLSASEKMMLEKLLCKVEKNLQAFLNTNLSQEEISNDE